MGWLLGRKRLVQVKIYLICRPPRGGRGGHGILLLQHRGHHSQADPPLYRHVSPDCLQVVTDATLTLNLDWIGVPRRCTGNTFSSRSEDSTGGLSSSLPPAPAPSQSLFSFLNIYVGHIKNHCRLLLTYMEMRLLLCFFLCKKSVNYKSRKWNMWDYTVLYQSAWTFVRIGSPCPHYRKRVCPPLGTKGGRDTRLQVKGRGSQFGRMPGTLPSLCFRGNSALL